MKPVILISVLLFSGCVRFPVYHCVAQAMDKDKNFNCSGSTCIETPSIFTNYNCSPAGEDEK